MRFNQGLNSDYPAGEFVKTGIIGGVLGGLAGFGIDIAIKRRADYEKKSE